MKAQNKIILGLLVAISSIMTPLSHAIVVGVDPTATWVGYMNVHAKDWSWYAFGSEWGVNNLKTTVSANGLTLQPNFNCYADAVTAQAREFWTDGAGGGNKGVRQEKGGNFRFLIFDFGWTISKIGMVQKEVISGNNKGGRRGHERVIGEIGVF